MLLRSTQFLCHTRKVMTHKQVLRPMKPEPCVLARICSGKPECVALVFMSPKFQSVTHSNQLLPNCEPILRQAHRVTLTAKDTP